MVIPSDARTRESIEKKLQPLSPTISKSELRLKRKDKYLEWASTGEERKGFWRKLARRMRRGRVSR